MSQRRTLDLNRVYDVLAEVRAQRDWRVPARAYGLVLRILAFRRGVEILPDGAFLVRSLDRQRTWLLVRDGRCTCTSYLNDVLQVWCEHGLAAAAAERLGLLVSHQVAAAQ